jgi:hypothetical protein
MTSSGLTTMSYSFLISQKTLSTNIPVMETYEKATNSSDQSINQWIESMSDNLPNRDN